MRSSLYPQEVQAEFEWVGLHRASCQVHGDTDQEEFLLAGLEKASLRS